MNTGNGVNMACCIIFYDSARLLAHNPHQDIILYVRLYLRYLWTIVLYEL